LYKLQVTYRYAVAVSSKVVFPAVAFVAGGSQGNAAVCLPVGTSNSDGQPNQVVRLRVAMVAR
jgi:hypothetical protein